MSAATKHLLVLLVLALLCFCGWLGSCACCCAALLLLCCWCCLQVLLTLVVVVQLLLLLSAPNKRDLAHGGRLGMHIQGQIVKGWYAYGSVAGFRARAAISRAGCM